MAGRHRRRDPDARGDATLPRAAPLDARPLDGARSCTRERRSHGVRRTVPGRLAARRAEDTSRGARADLGTMALHEQARPARHAAGLLRTPRILPEVESMSIRVE